MIRQLLESEITMVSGGDAAAAQDRIDHSKNDIGVSSLDFGTGAISDGAEASFGDGQGTAVIATNIRNAPIAY
jgi:hypothetical protein